jgi:hypothetical protein
MIPIDTLLGKTFAQADKSQSQNAMAGSHNSISNSRCPMALHNFNVFIA